MTSEFTQGAMVGVLVGAFVATVFWLVIVYRILFH